MNYEQIYNDLISYRLSKPATGYIERHHILMKSMGGSDDPSNIVVLTGREHWIAHLLLYKIHGNSQTIHACNMMAMRCEERGIPFIKSSRLYEEVRKHHAKLTSNRMKIYQRGEGNSQYGTRWICSIELQLNQKIKCDEKIPDGWILGRNKWKKAEKTTRERLSSRLCITDGEKNTTLYFKDQLPIPNGWKIGTTLSSEQRRKISERVSSSNKRRRGIKYSRKH